VGGVDYLARCLRDNRDNDAILGSHPGELPLLEFDDDGILLAARSESRHRDVDALGPLGQAEFHADPRVIGNVIVAKYTRHIGEGVPPRPNLVLRDAMTGRGHIPIEDDRLDVAVVVVAQELRLVGIVYEHWIPPSPYWSISAFPQSPLAGQDGKAKREGLGTGCPTVAAGGESPLQGALALASASRFTVRKQCAGTVSCPVHARVRPGLGCNSSGPRRQTERAHPSG